MGNNDFRNNDMTPMDNFLSGPPKRPVNKARQDAALEQKNKDMADIAKKFPNVMGQQDTNRPPEMLLDGDIENLSEPIEVTRPQASQTPRPPFQQPQPKPQVPPVRPVVNPNVEPVHPILSRLKEAFGLDTPVTHTVIIEGLSFVLQLINSERLAIAMRLAENKSIGPAEYGMYVKRSIASAVTMSIGGVSLEDVLEIPFKKNGVNLTPIMRRTFAIEEFFKLLSTNEGKWVSLGDKLYEIYQEVLDPKSILTTSISDVDGQVFYKCPVENCEVGRHEMPGTYYCHIHGAILVTASTLDSETNIPLDSTAV